MKDKTLRDIVTENFNAASVFEKYGLDFCCKGGISLDEACKQKGLNREQIFSELSDVAYEESSQRYFQWELPFLIDYIVNNHHAYIKTQVPLINFHLEKVIRAHGERHPEVKEVESIFHTQSQGLLNHMMKEENVLFPFIKQLVQSRSLGTEPPQAHFGDISGPIAAMLAEHEEVGGELARLRDLLLDYTPPDDACTTMRLLYQELEAFEKDLHKHVFLENTILFPKAIRIEREFGHEALERSALLHNE